MKEGISWDSFSPGYLHKLIVHCVFFPLSFLQLEVHTMLDALLPPDTYFRFNPLMNEDIALDENRKEKLNQLQMDGIRYLERNEEKLKKAAKILTQEKTALQRFNDWIRLKADMYEGFPFLSKL